MNDVLLATDLHAGNVRRAEREPWLVIDPKRASEIRPWMFARAAAEDRDDWRNDDSISLDAAGCRSDSQNPQH